MSNVTMAPDRSAGAPPQAAVTGARPLRRRSSLPSGRAVVGAFLVAGAALGIFAAYSRATAGPTTSYVIARHDVAIGSRLRSDDLTELPMDLPKVVADSAVFTDERQLVGTTTVGPIRRGELVQASAVVKKRSNADQLEVSFAIAWSRALAGSLQPGERVDVLATFGSGGDTYTVAVVRQAEVLQTSHRNGSLSDSDNETITLALASSDEALALTHAVIAGQVTLARATGTAANSPVGQTYRAPAAGNSPSPDKSKSGQG